MVGAGDPSPSSTWVERHFTATRAVYILTFVLTLQYVDRGIIAGAGMSIKGCVDTPDLCGKIPQPASCHGHIINDTCTNCRICDTTCQGDVVSQTGFGISTSELGILQSAFMLGYVCAAVYFAHAVQKTSQFRIIGLGLTLWIVAVTLSSFSGFWCNEDSAGGKNTCWSYYLMITARALSGVGEAALNTLSLPFLDGILDKESKGFYVGIYYSSIPVGTALGYMWAGLITQVTGYWEWAFLLEGPIMIPFVILAFMTPSDIAQRFNQKKIAEARLLQQSEEDDGYESASEFGECDSDSDDNEGSRSETAISLWTNVSTCLSYPSFVFASLGYAVYVGVVAGMGFYGPLFIQNYRPCDKRWRLSQSEADLIFGLILAVAGFIGTLFGGVLVDKLKRRSDKNILDTHLDQHMDECVIAEKEMQIRREALVKNLVAELVTGELLAFVMIFMTNPVPFFLLFLFTVSSFFMVTAGINLTIIWSVPVKNQPMAIALSVIIMHLLGDVPSPVLLGYISDTHSPLFTITTAVVSMTGAIFFWGFILILPKVKTRSNQAFQNDTAFDYEEIVDSE